MTLGAVAWTVNALVGQLGRLAEHDSLAGALTRSAFGDAAEQAISLAGWTGQPLCLALLDLDQALLTRAEGPAAEPLGAPASPNG